MPASQIAILQASIDAIQEEYNHLEQMEELRKKMARSAEAEIAQSRQADDVSE